MVFGDPSIYLFHYLCGAIALVDSIQGIDMNFFVRFSWFVSLLGFLYNLFTTYGNVQQVLVLQFGTLNFALTRGQYFFFFLVFFLVLNLLLFVLGKLVNSIPKAAFFVPNREFWTANRENRKAANRILGNWTWVIAATANYFMMYWMLVMENNFHFEGSTVSAVDWFYKPGLVMAATLILPVVRFLFLNTDLITQRERE